MLTILSVGYVIDQVIERGYLLIARLFYLRLALLLAVGCFVFLIFLLFLFLVECGCFFVGRSLTAHVISVLLAQIAVDAPYFYDTIFAGSRHPVAARTELDDPDGLLVCAQLLHKMHGGRIFSYRFVRETRRYVLMHEIQVLATLPLSQLILHERVVEADFSLLNGRLRRARLE